MASVSDISSQYAAQRSSGTSNSNSSGKVTNPKAELDKDAFMKLLLTELQYQDPTSPMDTEKMLTQTSQLAALEMQQNTNNTMSQLVAQLKSSSSMYALGSLGKMANTGVDSVDINDNAKSAKLPLYFKEPVSSGEIKILDAQGNAVRTISFKDMTAGVKTFEWDGKDDNGKQVANGKYTAQASYLGTDKKQYTSSLGKYPVEAVKFVDGKAQVKVAGEYISTDNIAEFYEG